jgi:polar amino acid transport system substrate-binding protein
MPISAHILLRPVPAAVAAALLFGAGEAAALTLEELRERGFIEVGVANERPYGFVAADGSLSGKAPTIARHVLAEIVPGVEMRPVVVPFADLIDGLLADEFDMIAAGMFVTPERCERVAFTDPTYRIGQAFAVKAGNPKDLTDYEAVALNEDAKVGLMAGAVEYNYAYEASIPADRALLFPDPEEALAALKEGEIDAVGLTSLTIRGLVDEADDPALEATPQFYPTVDGERVIGYGAFAFEEEDRELVDAFNRVLADFVGSEEHWRLVEEFGFTRDMAPDRSTDELCAGS